MVCTKTKSAPTVIRPLLAKLEAKMRMVNAS